jgi:hypothetical protein
MKRNHLHETHQVGPYYIHHLAYFHNPKGSHGEFYLEGLTQWLTQIHDGNSASVLSEIQACLGEATLSLTRLEPFEPSPLPPAFLHQNFCKCCKWMLACGIEWLKLEPFPQLLIQEELSAFLIDLSSQTYGAPPALLEGMDEFNPLYPSIPLSARRAWSELPEERHVHSRLSTLAVPEEELAPYEDDDPLTADFTMPNDHKVPQENPTNSEPKASPTSQDLSKLWEAPGVKTDRFLVELSPFVYLNSREKLKDELINHYGVGVI